MNLIRKYMLYRTIYTVIEIGLLIIMLMAYFFGDWPAPVFFGCFLVVLIVGVLILAGLETSCNKTINSICDILYVQCDPYTLIDKTDYFWKENRTRWFRVMILNLGLARVLALLDLGKREEADLLIARFGDELKVQKKPAVKAYICSGIYILSKRIEDEERAEEYLEKYGLFISWIKNEKTKQRFLESYETILEERRLIAERNDEDLALFYQEEVEKNSSYRWYEKVRLKNKEAQVQRRLGNINEEIECLLFVTEYGNKLPVVEEAAVRLNALEEGKAHD